MKKILLLLLLTASFAACEKAEDPKPTTPTCETGTIRFTNTSSNPYTIYIDEKMTAVMEGKTIKEYELGKGFHQFKAVQLSGYVLYPTERTATATFKGCDDVEFAFP